MYHLLIFEMRIRVEGVMKELLQIYGSSAGQLEKKTSKDCDNKFDSNLENFDTRRQLKMN